MDLIKNISFKTLIPFVLAFIAILAFHFSVDLTTDDYKYFRIYAFGYYEQSDVLSFLQWRYVSWTSRLLIEFFTFWFVQFPLWVFSVTNSLIILAIIAMTYLLFSQKKGAVYAMVAILLAFMYKISDQSSAGYLVTMIVYLWPLCAFLPTLFPFKNSIEKKQKYKWSVYAANAICALFCCNCEQICIAAIMTWGIFVLYTYLQTKTIDKLYCFLLLIAFAQLLFTVTCPGNEVRTVSELSRLPNYEHFGFVKKIALCVAAPITKYMVLYKQSMIVKAFTIILPLTAFYKNKKAYISWLVSIIPFVLLCSTSIKEYPLFANLYEASTSQICIIGTTSIAFYGSIIYSLLYIGKDENSLLSKYGPAFIFFVGLTTRACLGFTVSFQEDARTFFLLEYAMIAIGILYLSSYFKVEIKVRSGESQD